MMHLINWLPVSVMFSLERILVHVAHHIGIAR